MLGMTNRWTGVLAVVEEDKDWARTWMMGVKSETWVSPRDESVM